MSTATATADHSHGHEFVPPPDEHFGNASYGKIGMWLFLLSDAFSFGGLLLAYGILRGGAETWRHVQGQSWSFPSEPESLGIYFTSFLTFLLICSSVTMVLAVASAAENNRKSTIMWLALTALGGALFLVGQYQEYFGIVGHGLVSEGLVFGRSSYASTFYLITSFHGAHVLTGTIYILVTMFRTIAGKTDHNDIEILGLFWHFVDLVWILVFTFVYLV